MYQRMAWQEIYAYWDRLRGDNASPIRAQIEPAAIRHALPDLFILETAPENELRFRLVGTRICAVFGRELRGLLFHEVWAGGPASNPIEIAQGTILYESPVLMNLMGFFEDGETHRFDMLLLPLRSTEGVCDRLLGALVPVTGQERILPLQALRCLFMDRSRPLQRGIGGPTASAPKPQDRSVSL